MSEADQFTGRRYEIVGFANDQKPMFYEELNQDGEHGAWLLIAVDASAVSVYAGESVFCPLCIQDQFTNEFGIGPLLFGSRIGLDSQIELEKGVISEELRDIFATNGLTLSESTADINVTSDVEGASWLIDDDNSGDYLVIKDSNALIVNIYEKLWSPPFPRLSVSREEARQFVDRGEYKPLIMLPIDTMRRLCEERKLEEVMPSTIQKEDRNPAAQTIIAAMKMGMGWPLDADEADKEFRSRTLRESVRKGMAGKTSKMPRQRVTRNFRMPNLRGPTGPIPWQDLELHNYLASVWGLVFLGLGVWGIIAPWIINAPFWVSTSLGVIGLLFGPWLSWDSLRNPLTHKDLENFNPWG